MKIRIFQGVPCGSILPPPSKSDAHRALIAAACSEGESIIYNVELCDDIAATVDCLRALGVRVDIAGGFVRVVGRSPKFWHAERPLSCRASGSTLRFLLPLCALSGNQVTLIGEERLFARPMEPYEMLFAQKGILFQKERNSITVKGILPKGEYRLPADISSQFISGLLFALPHIEGETRIVLTTSPVSVSYIAMTCAVLSSFGADLCKTEEGYSVFGKQQLTPTKYTVEADWSGAAPWVVLNALGGKIALQGLSQNSLQGDRTCIDLAKRLSEGFCEVDLSDCPDLAPVLFALAAARYGGSFTGVHRLRDKESDRLFAMREELQKCNVNVEIVDDRAVICGKLTPPKVPLCGHGDHRIIMAEAILLTLLGGEIVGAEAVSKSYLSFFIDLLNVGILWKEEPDT